MAPVLESKSLLPSLVLLAVTLSLAATAGVMGHDFLDREERELTRVQDELASWEERLRQAESDIDAMQRALPRYQGLKRKGVIGDNRDVALLAVLGDNARRYHLEQVKYQLAAAEPWRPPFTYEEGAFDLLVSRLEINARAYHEEEVLDLLKSLMREDVGTVGSCDFSREEGGASALERATLSAECRLAWFTVREREVRR